MALAQSLLERWHQCRLSEVRSAKGLPALPDQTAAPIVDMYGLRLSLAPDRRDDLPQVVHVAASLVLRDVPDDKHPMRHLREAARAGAWRHLQDRLAHV